MSANDTLLRLQIESWIRKIEPPVLMKVSPDAIPGIVCETYGISETDLFSKTRKREIVEPRQMVIFLLNRLTKRSNNRICLDFRKNHSTGMHAIRKVTDYYRTEKAYRERMDAILFQIGVSPEKLFPMKRLI
jgi:chromosomal replication initiation ATPase DnaA